MKCSCGNPSECSVPEPMCRECAIEYYSLLVSIGATHGCRDSFIGFRYSPRDHALYIGAKFKNRILPNSCIRCIELNIFPANPVKFFGGKFCTVHISSRKKRKFTHLKAIA